MMWLQALLRAHDDVADRNYGDEIEEDSQLFSPPPPLSMFSGLPDQVRLVGIRREKNAPLVSPAMHYQLENTFCSEFNNEGYYHFFHLSEKLNDFYFT